MTHLRLNLELSVAPQASYAQLISKTSSRLDYDGAMLRTSTRMLLCYYRLHGKCFEVGLLKPYCTTVLWKQMTKSKHLFNCGYSYWWKIHKIVCIFSLSSDRFVTWKGVRHHRLASMELQLSLLCQLITKHKICGCFFPLWNVFFFFPAKIALVVDLEHVWYCWQVCLLLCSSN